MHTHFLRWTHQFQFFFHRFSLLFSSISENSVQIRQNVFVNHFIVIIKALNNSVYFYRNKENKLLHIKIYNFIKLILIDYNLCEHFDKILFVVMLDSIKQYFWMYFPTREAHVFFSYKNHFTCSYHSFIDNILHQVISSKETALQLLNGTRNMHKVNVIVNNSFYAPDVVLLLRTITFSVFLAFWNQ